MGHNVVMLQVSVFIFVSAEGPEKFPPFGWKWNFQKTFKKLQFYVGDCAIIFVTGVWSERTQREKKTNSNVLHRILKS